MHKQINQMNNLDIQASLRKVNKKFIEQLTLEQRKNVVKQFKKAYAQQMAKLTLEVSKKMKVQENLDQINEQEMKQVREIDEQLRKKMERHSTNREKLQQSKQKEYKLQEENWKRRLDDIVRKNKQKERDAHQKAQKIRKQAEQFWTKKQEAAISAQDNLKGEQSSRVSKAYHSSNKEQAKLLDRNKSLENELSKKSQFQLPQVKSTKIRRNDMDKNKTFNQSISANKLNEDIKAHQQKCTKTTMEQEAENYQKIIEKLQKIEKTRSIAKERMEKQVKQAKRIRQLKQNPETLAANRKRFLEQQFKPQKSKQKKLQGKKAQDLKGAFSRSQSGSRTNLDNSIISRLQTHKKIQEDQFQKRQQNFELALRKMKTTKMNRVVREAINMIKHQTLQD